MKPWHVFVAGFAGMACAAALFLLFARGQFQREAAPLGETYVERDNAVFWCAQTGGHACYPELRVAPADITAEKRQRWRDRAAAFAARGCAQRAAYLTACVQTRLVYCTDDDMCFLTRGECGQDAVQRNRGECVARFDGAAFP